jgi:hypothetical protein
VDDDALRPLIGANTAMIANKPTAVAYPFSVSSRLTSPGGETLGGDT